MNPLVLYGVIGALLLGTHGLVYSKGRGDIKSGWNASLAKIAAQAIEEKQQDDADQIESAIVDVNLIRDETVRLTQMLNARNRADVSDGRDCFIQSDVDGMLDDFDEVFKDRLQPSGRVDGYEGIP